MLYQKLHLPTTNNFEEVSTKSHQQINSELQSVSSSATNSSKRQSSRDENFHIDITPTEKSRDMYDSPVSALCDHDYVAIFPTSSKM